MITPDEKQILDAEYRVAKGELLNVHNRITEQVSAAVKNRLSPDETRLLAESRSSDPDALDAYFRGLDHWEKLTPEDFIMAKQSFERAIDIDPDWGPPYAGLASVWLVQVFFMAVPPEIGLPEAYKYRDKAVELDPNSANTHYTNAQLAAWADWDWETAEEEYLKSLELNPNDALCHMYYSHMLMCLRRFDEAVYQARLGRELDPENPLVLGLFGVVMFTLGDYHTAIEHFEKSLSIDSTFDFFVGQLYLSSMYAGDHEKWIPDWKEYSCWDDTVKTNIEKTFYEDGLVPGFEKLLDYNDKYGSPDCHLNVYWELLSSEILDDCERVLDCLEEIFEIPNKSIMPYIASGSRCDYDQMKEYPRYIELLKQVNLPLPED
jgi:tetratricopeptide (TPR) repeat protein